MKENAETLEIKPTEKESKTQFGCFFIKTQKIEMSLLDRTRSTQVIRTFSSRTFIFYIFFYIFLYL